MTSNDSCFFFLCVVVVVVCRLGRAIVVFGGGVVWCGGGVVFFYFIIIYIFIIYERKKKKKHNHACFFPPPRPDDPDAMVRVTKTFKKLKIIQYRGCFPSPQARSLITQHKTKTVQKPSTHTKMSYIKSDPFTVSAITVRPLFPQNTTESACVSLGQAKYQTIGHYENNTLLN